MSKVFLWTFLIIVNYFKVKENNNKAAYAGKNFLPRYMCQLIKEENLYLDVDLYEALEKAKEYKNIKI